ncbi:hypothetical protein [Streptomyces sp. NPDC059080]|uniref:hypothetical protein n=1 Tax=Streptomyces sp. NPDC059080 TaxID=3346718 RepID=UPI0036A7ED08
MTDQHLSPGDTSAVAFDLVFLRTRAAEYRLTDEDLTALTGIPTTDWGTHLTPHTLPAATLFILARALNTSAESLLRQLAPNRRPAPAAADHATVLHAALLEADRIHPDDLASALEWTPHRLGRAATTLAAHLEQQGSPQRLVHTDTTIHLTCVPDLLDPKQRQNLHNCGHTAASLAPGEAAALARLLHHTARDLPPRGGGEAAVCSSSPRSGPLLRTPSRGSRMGRRRQQRMLDVTGLPDSGVVDDHAAGAVSLAVVDGDVVPHRPVQFLLGLVGVAVRLVVALRFHGLEIGSLRGSGGDAGQGQEAGGDDCGALELVHVFSPLVHVHMRCVHARRRVDPRSGIPSRSRTAVSFEDQGDVPLTDD